MRPTDTTAKQPLELVREYFGEKIALFYTWFGFYCTMLWVPSLFSIFVFGTNNHKQCGQIIFFISPEERSFSVRKAR